MAEEPRETEEFRAAAGAPRPSLAAEFWDFLKENKKWWLVPILVALALVGLLVLLGGTSLAPLLYTVF